MKKLCKSRKDKRLCGVCGGLAEYFEIDSTIVRLVVAAVVLCSCSTALLAYLLAALIIPFEN